MVTAVTRPELRVAPGMDHALQRLSEDELYTYT